MPDKPELIDFGCSTDAKQSEDVGCQYSKKQGFEPEIVKPLLNNIGCGTDNKELIEVGCQYSPEQNFGSTVQNDKILKSNI